MTGKRKIQIHIVAALVVVCLIGWIIMLYVERYQKEKDWETQFLMRYHAVLNDAVCSLGQFEGAKSFEDQIFYLEAVTNDLIQLKADMEVHISLVSRSMPEEMASVDSAGWHEAETIVGFINYGGTINSYKIESFRADGTISEEEAAIIQFLKEEVEKLYSEMTALDEDGMNYKYVLSSVEVYRRLAEIMQNVKTRLIQINQKH